MAKRSKRATVPLVIEPHPENYNGYPFITLIQYRDEHILAIVDNASDKTIEAFVLDLCGPEQINEEMIISIAEEWYGEDGARYPLSIEFSKRGMTQETAKLIRSFKIDFVTRVIGPLMNYPMDDVKSVKRRRRKPVPEGMEVNRKLISPF